MHLGKVTLIEGVIDYAGDPRGSPLNDLYLVLRMLQDIAQECQLTVLQISHHSFKPHGLTALYLLSESHISIHTWPESNRFALDVYSCKEGYNVQAIIERIQKDLPLLNYQRREFDRAI